jgi:hypothetical protein
MQRYSKISFSISGKSSGKYLAFTFPTLIANGKHVSAFLRFGYPVTGKENAHDTLKKINLLIIK